MRCTIRLKQRFQAAAGSGLKTVNGVGVLSNQVSVLIDFFFGIDLGPEGKTAEVRAIKRVTGRA